MLPFGPVLERFGQVGRGDVLAAGQVGDGAGELEHAVVGAGGELEMGLAERIKRREVSSKEHDICNTLTMADRLGQEAIAHRVAEIIQQHAR